MQHLSPRALPLASTGEDAHTGLAFSLSKLLAQKMQSGQAALSSGSKKGKKKDEGEGRPAFLVSRCPRETLARLDGEGGCFCGKLDSSSSGASTSTICHGYDENDRKAVCVEDLRDDWARWDALEAPKGKGKAGGVAMGKRKKVERSGRRRATCGLEFLPGFEPPSRECPIGYAQIGDPNDTKAPFICQDTASPYSCGTTQRDCYAQPGVLQAECVEGACEIVMCKEGWRFHVVMNDDGQQDQLGFGFGGTSCVPSKPLFFAPPV
ncbi:hypothetical protein JCM8547_005673 [Rhodosporidiobolus lusitaniae]